MTSRRRTDDEHYQHDIIGDKPRRDDTAGLDLFAQSIPSTPSLQMLGAGQRARQEAREKSNPDAGRVMVLRALEAAPDGLTRSELHEVTGLAINSVNARVAELASPTKYAAGTSPVYTLGVRERVVVDDQGNTRTLRESVCFARAARPQRVEQEGAA